MPARVSIALVLSGLLSIGAIAVGLVLLVDRTCGGDGSCDDAVIWVLGISFALAGAAMLAGTVVISRVNPGYGGQLFCTIWACLLLLLACAIGGASNVTGVIIAVCAIAMGAVAVWADG